MGDLVGVQNYAAGSKPTYQTGSKHVSYDVHGNTGPATYGDISGNSNRVGESSVAAGGGQSGTIKDTNSKDSGFGGLRLLAEVSLLLPQPICSRTKLSESNKAILLQMD